MRQLDIDKAAVIAAYRENPNAPAIAKRFGYGNTTVYRWLAAAGVPRVGAPPPPKFNPPRRFTDEQEAEIVRRYVAGERTGSLRAAFGCSSDTIRQVARRHGAMVYGRGNRWREFSADEVAKMAALWRDGASQTEIGEIFRTNQPNVSRILRFHGIETSHRKPCGERHGSWRGGRTHLSGGYVAVRVLPDSPFASMRLSSGYVLEHRLVMAQKLGRPLARTEVVHHINGDRKDNRPENLELWSASHPRGVRVEGRHCPTCTCACGRKAEN